MKKVSTQICIAIIFVILGFLIIYQFKSARKNIGYNGTDIISELDNLNSEKDELTKIQSELTGKLKLYEDNAAKETSVGIEIKKQLDNARIELGLVPVVGPGVKVTLTKKNTFFGGNFNDNSQSITEVELVHLINLLWFSQAEAIEVNDFRITPQIGIKNSGKFITIGSAGKIDPSEKIVIKATGDVSKLKKNLGFKMDVELGALKNYDLDIEEKSELVINKTTESINTEYIESVN